MKASETYKIECIAKVIAWRSASTYYARISIEQLWSELPPANKSLYRGEARQTLEDLKLAGYAVVFAKTT